MKAIPGKVLWTSTERMLLGECPLWDDQEQALWWVDTADPAVYCLQAGKVQRFACPKPVASIFFTSERKVVVALRQGLMLLDPLDGSLESLPDTQPPSAEERYNDGRCGPDGRLWISTMDRALKSGIGTLSGLDGRGGPALVAPTGAKLGNGVCFSPDGRWLYFSDSVARQMWRYPLSGSGLAPRELLVTLDEAPGRPDGCAVDTQGCLWSARVGGGRIDRYSPEGVLLGWLETPVTHPTHCAFGGPELRTLYVTSLRFPAGASNFEGQPLAGAVLAYSVDATGLAEQRFAWPPGGGPALQQKEKIA